VAHSLVTPFGIDKPAVIAQPTLPQIAGNRISRLHDVPRRAGPPRKHTNLREGEQLQLAIPPLDRSLFRRGFCAKVAQNPQYNFDFLRPAGLCGIMVVTT